MTPTVRRTALAVLAALPLAGAPPALAMYHGMAAPAGGETAVEVILDEWRVDLSVTRLAPGRVVFRLVNAGRYPHALALERADGPVGGPSVTLRGGQRADYTVDLPAGRYRVVAYCPIPGHREQGMVAELEVG